jgi:tetratricopeptide (TPR) repeat protein
LRKTLCLGIAIAAALSWLGLVRVAAAAVDDEVLTAAVAAYGAAMDDEDRSQRLESFRRSERLFAQAIESGARNAEIYTNLGSAALQGERLGYAMLAYRRALLLDPDHARALQNLDHARGQLPSWVPRPTGDDPLDSFFFGHRTLSAGERTIAAALCFALAVLLLAASVRFDSSTPRNIAILPTLVWCALLASLFLDRTAESSGDAVITVETAARAADSTFAPSLFPAPLPEGTEVRVLEDRTPWMRVRLANRRNVWVKASSLAPVHESGFDSRLEPSNSQP